MNELDFSGRQVLVVGGSSGIGKRHRAGVRARPRVAVCAPALMRRIIRRRRIGFSGASNISQLDVVEPAGDRANFKPSFEKLDVCWCWRRAR